MISVTSPLEVPTVFVSSEDCDSDSPRYVLGNLSFFDLPRIRHVVQIRVFSSSFAPLHPESATALGPDHYELTVEQIVCSIWIAESQTSALERNGKYAGSATGTLPPVLGK